MVVVVVEVTAVRSLLILMTVMAVVVEMIRFNSAYGEHDQACTHYTQMRYSSILLGR